MASIIRVACRRTGSVSPLQQSRSMQLNCYLEPTGFVAATFASGLATLTADELEIGALVIDLGAGTTSFGLFSGGHLIHADAIPSGGDHVTLDIAKGLGTPRLHAERIKTLYGTVQGASSDATEPIHYPLAGDSVAETEQTTRADLRAIIQPRVELVLGEVKTRLDAAGLLRQASGGVVLTGGASALQGIAGFASAIFGQPVRLGASQPIDGLEETGSPVFSATLGALLVRTAANVSIGRTLIDGQSGALMGDDGYLLRVGRWLRMSFWEDERSREAPL
jgi:cell division protein FtsA